jgi:succinoglycan biosynthesis protein ExoL
VVPATGVGSSSLGYDARSGPVLVLFTPDITETSTIKRAHELLSHGFDVVVFGFRRDRYNCAYVPRWPHVELGRTADRRYWHRLGSLLRAGRILLRQRGVLARASLLYARNIDQLLLALLMRRLFRPQAAVVYEVLDVQPTLTGRGVLSRALRLVERACLRHVRLLVVSSPGFMQNYYLPTQRYRREWYLLENKLDPSTLPSAAARPPAGPRKRRDGPYKWVVGYFGLVRGDPTFELMERLAARFRDQVLFKIRGVLTTVDRQRFSAMLARNPNMVYEGEYVSPTDLAAIYGEVDFAWALDLEHVQHNSRWLLPCRFYEAGLHGVPCLAAHGFEVGRMIERLGAGWTFDAPLEHSLATFFESLSDGAYAAIRSRLASLPTSTFVAGEDVAVLCELLRGEAATVEPPARYHAHYAAPVVPPVTLSQGRDRD